MQRVVPGCEHVAEGSEHEVHEQVRMTDSTCYYTVLNCSLSHIGCNLLTHFVEGKRNILLGDLNIDAKVDKDVVKQS